MERTSETKRLIRWILHQLATAGYGYGQVVAVNGDGVEKSVAIGPQSGAEGIDAFGTVARIRCFGIAVAYEKSVRYT